MSKVVAAGHHHYIRHGVEDTEANQDSHYQVDVPVLQACKIGLGGCFLQVSLLPRACFRRTCLTLGGTFVIIEKFGELKSSAPVLPSPRSEIRPGAGPEVLKDS
jgi:hypothetical protein